ncbi:MAG: hypothetical protein AAB610_00310 [Patescibacteria group bacterium]
MDNKDSLQKITEYVTEFVLGGQDKYDLGGQGIRQLMLEEITKRPDLFLEFARQQMQRMGTGENPQGWVMGAVHAFRDANISIDDPNVAARHIMEAIKERFKDEIPTIS